MSFFPRWRIRRNSTGDGISRDRFNVIEGPGILLTLDESDDEEASLTIESSLGDGEHDILSDTHLDTDATDTPVDLDVLTWDGYDQVWRAEPASAHGSHGSATHDILSAEHDDTNATDTPADQEVLTHDGTEWSARPPSYHGEHGGSGSGQNVFPNDRLWVQNTAGLVTAETDEFRDGSLAGDWSVVETAHNITVAEGADVLSVSHPGSDAASELHGIIRAWSPAGSFQIETAIRVTGDGSSNRFIGLIASTNNVYGAGTQALALFNKADNGTSYGTVDCSLWTNWNNRASSNALVNVVTVGAAVHLRLEYNSGTGVWTTRWGIDGVSWRQAATQTSTKTITHVGLAMTSFSGTGAFLCAFEYFRAYE